MADAHCLFRCRKCRECVFDSRCVVTVHGQQHPISDGSIILPLNSSCKDVTMETVWYIAEESAPAWILKTVELAFWSKGKLLCPKCGGRLGSFDFIKTTKCACGKFTLPTIHILQCRVDLRTSSAAIQNCNRIHGDNIVADPSNNSEKNDQISSNTEEGFNLDISTSFSPEKMEHVDRSSDLTFEPDPASTVDSSSSNSPLLLRCSEKTSAGSFGKVNLDIFPLGADRSFREAELESANRWSVLDANYNSTFTTDRTRSFERERADIDISLPESNVHRDSVLNHSKECRKSELIEVMENFFKGDNQQKTGNQEVSPETRIWSDGAKPTEHSKSDQGHIMLPEGHRYMDFANDRFTAESWEGSHFSERQQLSCPHPSRREQSEHPCSIATKQFDGPYPRTMEQLDGPSPSTRGQSQQHSFLSRTEQSDQQYPSLGGESDQQYPSLGGESDHLKSENASRAEQRRTGSPENLKQRRGYRCRRGKRNNAALSADLDQKNEVVDPDYPEEHICPLCLDLYCYPMRTRPCNHVFCDTCLRRLAQAKPVNTPCPLCRQVITKCLSDDDFAKDLNTLYTSLYKKRQVTENRFRNNSYHKLPEASVLRFHNTGQNPVRERNNNGWMEMVVLASRYVTLCVLMFLFVIHRVCRQFSKTTIVVGLILLALLAMMAVYITTYTVTLIGSMSQLSSQAIVEFLGGLVLSPQVESFQSESTQSLLPASVRIRALTANFFLIVIVVLICRYVFFRRVMFQLRRNA